MKDYKYLGVYLDNKMYWAKNTEAEGPDYFLRRLRSFNIWRTVLRMFYESVVLLCAGAAG